MVLARRMVHTHHPMSRENLRKWEQHPIGTFLEPVLVANRVTEASMNPALEVNRATEISSIQAPALTPVLTPGAIVAIAAATVVATVVEIVETTEIGDQYDGIN